METLCNYETSLMLKEIGFNETCEYCFDTSRPSAVERQASTNVFGAGKHNSSDPYLVACPSIKEAASWLYGQHNVNIHVHSVPNASLRFFRCYGLPSTTDGVVYTDTDSCRQAAVQFTLRLLLNK